MKGLLSILLAVCLLLSTAMAETWICPVCGRENDNNFCPDDATPRTEAAQYDDADSAEKSADESTAEPTSGSAAASAPEEKHLADYIPGSPTVCGLLTAADWALEDGMDPQKVGEELYALADENENLDALLWFAENLVSYGNEGYQKFEEYFDDKAQSIDLSPMYNANYLDNINVYDHDKEISDTLRNLLTGDSAEYCYSPVFWSESDFKSFYNTSFSNFKPSSPRAGYVCVVVSDSSQSSPTVSWLEDDNGNFAEALDDIVDGMLLDLDDDAPILTGNPNLASTFWVFELQYPFHAKYGQESPYVMGYNCTSSMKVIDAATRSAICSISGTSKLGSTIYKWNNYIAKADVPDLTEDTKYNSFLEKVRKNLIQERSKAASGRKITSLNASRVLNGTLAAQADSTKDGWQKAIYAAGAQNVSLQGNTLTFCLRPYSLQLSALGKYADAEDGTQWLRSALENATAYTLEVSVPVKDGAITNNGLNTLKQTVTKAAQSAKTAFSGKEFTSALTAYYFPSPIEGKLTNADALLEPSSAFENRMTDILETRDYLSPSSILSCLLYTRKSLKVDVSGGPDSFAFICVCADSAEMMETASKTVLDTLAYTDKENRKDSDDEISDALKHALAAQAVVEQKNATNKLTFTVSLDELLAGDLPEAYIEYLKAFNFCAACSTIEETSYRLLDIAAIQAPKSGKLSGGSSGTQITFKLSGDSYSTYIQMRNASTNELAMSCFVAAGKSLNVKVPKGKYIILWASGPYWYGEEELFGNLCTMNKSEETEIKGSSYTHTFTLESSEDGTIGIYDADLTDFK